MIFNSHKCGQCFLRVLHLLISLFTEPYVCILTDIQNILFFRKIVLFLRVYLIGKTSYNGKNLNRIRIHIISVLTISNLFQVATHEYLRLEIVASNSQNAQVACSSLSLVTPPFLLRYASVHWYDRASFSSR